MDYRVNILAVNDAPRVRLPGQVFRRIRSVVWPETEDMELITTSPLYTDEDNKLDIPDVSVSGKTPWSRCMIADGACSVKWRRPDVNTDGFSLAPRATHRGVIKYLKRLTFNNVGHNSSLYSYFSCSEYSH